MNYGRNNKFSLIKADFLSTFDFYSNLSKRHKTQNCFFFQIFFFFVNNTQTYPKKPPCCFTERPGVESDSHAYVVILVLLGSNPATQLSPLTESGSCLLTLPKIMQGSHVMLSTHLPVSGCDIIS